MTTAAGHWKYGSGRIAATTVLLWLLVALLANQNYVECAEGNQLPQGQQNFMGQFPDGFNNPAANDLQSTVNQMSNPLMGNMDPGSIRPMLPPQPQQQQQQQQQQQLQQQQPQPMVQGMPVGKLPMQGSNPLPIQSNGQPLQNNDQPLMLGNGSPSMLNNGQPLMQNNDQSLMHGNVPPSMLNNGQPLMQNNDQSLMHGNVPPSMLSNGQPEMQNNDQSLMYGNVPPPMQVGLPQDQTQIQPFIPSGPQQGPNLNLPQGMTMNPPQMQNGALQTRPPQEVNFNNKVAQNNPPAQMQQPIPQQYQQSPQSYPQVPQKPTMPTTSFSQPTQPLKQPTSPYYSYDEPSMDQQNLGAPQPINNQIPSAVNYPPANGQIQQYTNGYPAQPPNAPIHSGDTTTTMPFPMNFGNMLPMEALSSMSPMPMVQQSMGMVGSAAGNAFDRFHQYSTGLQQGLGAIGLKLIDGGQSAMHGVAEVAMALPDAIFNLKRDMFKNMQGTGSKQPNTMQQFGTYNYAQNAVGGPRPPYSVNDGQQQAAMQQVQPQLQQQQLQQQPQQLQQQPQQPVVVMMSDPNPVNSPQSINRYGFSGNNGLV